VESLFRRFGHDCLRQIQDSGQSGTASAAFAGLTTVSA
jgi:hypothetical protein